MLQHAFHPTLLVLLISRDRNIVTRIGSVLRYSFHYIVHTSLNQNIASLIYLRTMIYALLGVSVYCKQNCIETWHST